MVRIRVNAKASLVVPIESIGGKIVSVPGDEGACQVSIDLGPGTAQNEIRIRGDRPGVLVAVKQLLVSGVVLQQGVKLELRGPVLSG